MSNRTIKVDYIARVEGEGSLVLRFQNDQVKEVQLKIFEPPRFFEAFLRGRGIEETPDITARICGICPVAYQMSSCYALEDLVGIRVEGQLRALRRLLYCGEWLESHLLHVFMLHAPDFLKFPDALTMAKEHPEVVKRGLRMKKVGNSIVQVVGGREIHPVNVKLGGFYRAPEPSELRALLPELRWASGAAQESLAWLATLSYPKMERDYELVALQHPTEYAVCDGKIVSNKGLSIDVREYEDVFVEEHVSYSNALQSRKKGGSVYLCGPLARINLNFERLHPTAKKAAEQTGFVLPCLNPFRSIQVRMIESIHAFEEAIQIIESYQKPEAPAVSYSYKEGVGYGATEAPRGLLFHRYNAGADGKITDAKIVAPTSQNQGMIEDDLRALSAPLLSLPHAEATHLAEQAIRNYDPCISCATHFLTLKREEITE